MLIATWIITFILIIAVGIYAGTKIAHALIDRSLPDH